MRTWCEVRNFASQKFRLTPESTQRSVQEPMKKCRGLLQILEWYVLWSSRTELKLVFWPASTSDSVTRVNDSTRVTIFGDSDSNRVTLRKMVTRLESLFYKMTRFVSSHSQWLETRFRVIFTKPLSSWWTNPLRLHSKKWAVFVSVMIKIGSNFLLCLSSRSMLPFKDQVSPPCTEVDLRLCFQWGVSRAQYIDTLSWFNAVFAYRDHGSGPHTVTLTLFQIPVKLF